MAYTKYSLTPADNNAAPPNGAPEGMLPSGVNDTMRDMMAQIRDVGDGIRGGTYTMTAPVITGGSITGVALLGNTLTNPVITGAAISTSTLTGNTFTSPVISGGSINNTPIGATTANTGKFTTLEATGVTTVQAGTAAAPAITTTGDTNTGIFFSAADTIDFAEGGVATGQFDSSGNFKFNSGYGSVATAYGCRAWVNFDGTGTPAIRASGNVSSITDSGTGDYRVNFTTAMPDANYSIVASSINAGVAYALASSSTQTASQGGVATFLNSAPNTTADVNTILTPSSITI
jgi:hypothetical protein